MSPSSLEFWSYWTGWLAVGLTGLAALFGALAWYFSSVLGDIKDERARLLEKETAEAKLELERLKNPRRLDIKKFRDALIGKPPREVEMLYQPGHNEAHNLATQIFMALLDSSWKPANPWKSFPRPIPSKAARNDLKELEKISPELFNAIPPILRLTTSPFGVSVMANKSPSPPDAPQRDLANAMHAAGLGTSMGVIPELPDNLLLVVVGPRP